jgi:hypothetical protein
MNNACKLLLFLLFLGLSCQKDGNVKKDDPPGQQQDLSLVKKARSYYYKDLKARREAATTKFEKLYPYWNFAYSGKAKNNVEFVEVPVVAEKRRTNTIMQVPAGSPHSKVTKESELPVLSASLQRLLIFKRKDGSYDQRVVNYIPDKEYLKKAGHDISRNHIDQMDPEFSGYIHYSDKNGQPLYILRIKNGKNVGKIQHRKTGAPPPSNQRAQGEVCQWYEVTVWQQDCFTFEPDGPNGPSEEICTDWYIADQYYEEECWWEEEEEEEEEDPGDPDPDPEPAPGDKLCSASINFRSSDASHIANVTGLRFEGGGSQINNLPSTLFSITNGIRESSLNQVPNPDYMTQGKTCMEYLHDFFPTLFSTGQITTATENGETIYQFTAQAAQIISGRASNLAALGVTLQMGSAASIPGNTAAHAEFYKQSTELIRSWMPGSVIKQGYSPNGNNSGALYAPTCN